MTRTQKGTNVIVWLQGRKRNLFSKYISASVAAVLTQNIYCNYTLQLF